MKTIYLLRHAKAESDSATGDDFDRALSARGNADAVVVAGALKDQDLIPDIVLCSSSRRTRETCAHIAKALDLETKIETCPSLYLAPEDGILDAIADKAGTAQTVMVIGHNPGLELLAYDMDAQNSPPKFPTCAFAAFEFDVKSWDDIVLGRGRLTGSFTPKTLRG